MERILTKRDLASYKSHHYLTVGDLKKFLEKNNLPDDALVVSQRVHDLYFEKNGWGVYKKRGHFSHMMIEHNRKVQEGVYDDKEQFPDMTDDLKALYTEEEIDAAAEQYHPVWCAVKYGDEDDILFLDLHY